MADTMSGKSLPAHSDQRNRRGGSKPTKEKSSTGPRKIRSRHSLSETTSTRSAEKRTRRRNSDPSMFPQIKTPKVRASSSASKLANSAKASAVKVPAARPPPKDKDKAAEERSRKLPKVLRDLVEMRIKATAAVQRSIDKANTQQVLNGLMETLTRVCVLLGVAFLLRKTQSVLSNSIEALQSPVSLPADGAGEPLHKFVNFE